MVDTISASTSTAGVITLGRSVYGEIDTNGDHDWYRIQLSAGTTYEFRLHGIGPDQVADPTLAVRIDNTSAPVASNDDAGEPQWGGANNRDSFIQFTPTTTGTYYLDVGEFADNATGEFLLTAVVDNPAGMDFTVDEIAWQIQNNYNEHTIGGGNSRQFIWNDATNGGLSVNITALDADGQFLARNALQAWTLVSGVRFNEVSTGGQIVFDDNAAGQVARANWTHDGSFITAATVQVSRGWLDNFGFTGFGNYSFETYIHEIGHALGLGHGGNYDGAATFGTDNYYRNDSVAYSIMSYLNANNDEFSGGSVNTNVDASFRFMLTPAMADIIAIQNMYTSQQATVGHTTYGFNANSGNAAIDSFATVGSSGDAFMTVFDQGGEDTFDFSGQSNPNQTQRIFLEAESFSDVLGGTKNVSIARGVQIENALGGAGDDLLVGNALSNTLRGGGGNDVLIGGSEHDFLFGEDGNDRFQLIAIESGNVSESYIGGAGTDRLQLFGFATYTHNLRDDSVFGIEEIELTDPGDFQTSRVEIAGQQIGPTGFLPTGSVIGEVFDTVANVFAVYIDTENSVNLGSMLFFNFFNPNDRVEINGDVSNETIIATGVRDIVTAGGGNDLIFSFGGNDTLDGGTGNDRFQAGLGNDRYIGGLGIDTADFSAAAGPINVDLKLTGAQNTGEGLDVFSGIENLIGSAFGDTLVGDAPNNRIEGGGGNDTLKGNAAHDTLLGGADNDLVYGEAGNDTLDGGAGIDRLYDGAGNDTVFGGADADQLFAGPAIDRLDGGAGNDRLYAHAASADTFVFASAVGIDRVFNFLTGVHNLEIDASVYGGAAGAFVFRANANPVAPSATRALLYDTDDGKLWFDADGNGAGARVHVLTLFGAPTLAAADILLV